LNVHARVDRHEKRIRVVFTSGLRDEKMVLPPSPGGRMNTRDRVVEGLGSDRDNRLRAIKAYLIRRHIAVSRFARF
jgi:hypothetical protein